MAWQISFEIVGDHFNPALVDIHFADAHDATTISETGRYKGKAYGYGRASYIVPKEIPRLERFKHLATIFVPLFPQLKKAGADNWYINIGRLYYGQCNEELSFEELQAIAQLQCSLSYSAYIVDSEEEEKRGFGG